MNRTRNISRRTAIIIAVTAGLIVVAAGAAFTASFVTAGDKLGAGAAGTTGCDTNGITAGVATPMDWSIGSGPGTDVEFSLSNVNVACNGKQWKATVGTATTLECIAQGSGTLSVAGSGGAGTATIVLNTDGCVVPGNPGGSGGVGSLTVTFYD